MRDGPVTCPLCGVAVDEEPRADGRDLRALERHLGDDCPVRVG